jgi:hypothetical protein
MPLQAQFLMTPFFDPARTTLEVEDEPLVRRPTIAMLHAAIDRMRPTGPAFVIVASDNGDYAQAGGGSGRFAVEWREYGEPFVHLLAGKGTPVDETCIVPMHYGCTRVCLLEVLSIDDVKTLLSAFLRDGLRPEGYVWRDVAYAFMNKPASGDGMFLDL